LRRISAEASKLEKVIGWVWSIHTGQSDIRHAGPGEMPTPVNATIRFALPMSAQSSSTAAKVLLIEVTSALRSPEFVLPDIN
jgi:hypothetical protein